jgi:hypothetical protein
LKKISQKLINMKIIFLKKRRKLVFMISFGKFHIYHRKKLTFIFISKKSIIMCFNSLFLKSNKKKGKVLIAFDPILE